MKIALLLQEHFIKYCKSKIDEEWSNNQITYFQYEDLVQLQSLFLENKASFDAFIVSGMLPLCSLRAVDQPPYAIKDCFGGYVENTYRILLKCMLKRQSITPARIGLDYLDDGAQLPDVLEHDLLPSLVTHLEQQMLEMAPEHLMQFEQNLVEKYQRQCRSGKLDIIVTYFYSVVSALKNENVECYYSYPGKNSLVQTLRSCAKSAHLTKLQKNASAVIRVSPHQNCWGDRFSSSREMGILALKQSLLEYCRQHWVDPILKDDLTDIEIYLNAEQLKQMTAQFTYFDLVNYLEQKTSFHGLVSLGTGADLADARMHAMQARDYGQRLEEPVCVYMDEEGLIHSLPGLPPEVRLENGVSADYVELVANQCHLSAETIYRIISVMRTERSDHITSEALIRVQGFSLRLATRTLKALEEGGYAEKIGQNRVGNKGRPQNVYHVLIKYL